MRYAQPTTATADAATDDQNKIMFWLRGRASED